MYIHTHPISGSSKLMRTPACSVHGIMDEMRQIHTDYRNPVEENPVGKILWRKILWRTWLLSQWKRGPAPSLAWTGFYCFSGHITLRMVLTYYTQFCCRWLPFTDNKGKNIANYFKEKDVTDQGKSGWTGYTPYLGGLAQILGSYFKVCSKHLLPQFRVRDF